MKPCRNCRTRSETSYCSTDCRNAMASSRYYARRPKPVCAWCGALRQPRSHTFCNLECERAYRAEAEHEAIRERRALARFAARQAAENARDAPYAPKAYRAPTLADAEAIQGILAPPRGDVLTGNARQASYGAGQPRTGSWE